MFKLGDALFRDGRVLPFSSDTCGLRSEIFPWREFRGQAEDVVAGLRSGLMIHRSCVEVETDTSMFCDCYEVKCELLR